MSTILVWVLFVVTNVEGAYPVMEIHENQESCVRIMHSVQNAAKSEADLINIGVSAECMPFQLTVFTDEDGSGAVNKSSGTKEDDAAVQKQKYMTNIGG